MKDYLLLISSPSKALDTFDGKRPNAITLYIIFTVATIGGTLPKYIAASMNSPKGIEALIIYLMFMPFVYFPFVYGLSYCYWIVCRGFKGSSTHIEMKNLIVFSTLPFIFLTIFSIPFVAIGVLRNDIGLITHYNYFAYVILWLFSFRILMVGIAKYNKFNWTITLIAHLIVTSVLGSLAYLLLQLKR
jgi:hypothetical protein